MTDSTIRSMTGFGRSVKENGVVSIEVEVKSFNHRFLDISIKLPREYSRFEHELRDLISSALPRGRVEVFISRKILQRSKEGVKFDREMFKHLFEVYFEQARKEAGLQNLADEIVFREHAMFEVLRRSDVLGIEEGTIDENFERDCLLATIREALASLCEMRAREGVKLCSDIGERLQTLCAIRERIESSSSNTQQAIRERMLSRLSRVSPDIKIDETRLAQEVALLCDRVDFTEELVRLGSHLCHFKSAMNDLQGGRKLDFLTQEIGREFNTIGSKAQDALVQTLVIDAKQELEKIREQIQNLE